MSSEKSDKTKNKSIFETIKRLGLLLVALSLVGAFIVFYPVISKEIKYLFSKPDTDVSVASSEVDAMKFLDSDVIIAEDPEFSIIVPKIGANSKVVSDVDPFNSKVYQQALARGVAHAKGTVYPGEAGNSFYFAHSSDTFYNANRYNSVFYLLNKIEKGDTFYLVYQNEIYRYEVIETSMVKPEDINYMSPVSNKKIATLMTCWPAGTTISRLVVVGELKED